MRQLASALVLLGLIGCGEDGPAPAADDTIDISQLECENLNPSHCLLPWPSNRFLADDAMTPTKKRVALPASGMPANKYGDRISTDPYNRADGFSPMTAAMTVLRGSFDTSLLAAEDRIAESLMPSSRTVLLDAETGERVAHFAEIDGWSGADPERPVLYVRPAQRLEEGNRYIVAIQDLPVAPFAYFRALRDRTPTGIAELEARREHFEEIFTKLADAGVARERLVEAWDFSTGSGQGIWSDLVAMRDDAMMRVGPEGIACTVTEVVEDPTGAEPLWRRVTGTFTVPLYMDSAMPGARIVRGPDGRPMTTGMAEAPFTVVIPRSVRESISARGGPVRLVTYGHGLLGTGAGEVTSEYPVSLADRAGVVMVATDWWGMSQSDRDTVVAALGDFSLFPTVPERLMQGIVNTLVLTRTFAGVCSQIEELRVGRRETIDPTQRFFIGISQGSILGTTTAALSVDIERFVLNVGAISFPTMMRRSTNFSLFEALFMILYRDKLERDLMVAMSAAMWDWAEPATYAPHLLADPLPGTTPFPKRILYQVGRHDAQVPNVASDMAARTIGLPLLAPAAYEPWDIAPTMGPLDSAYVVYDTQVEPQPIGSVPYHDTDTHEAVRRLEAAQLQIDTFIRADGQVQSFCDGPCDPE